MCGLLLLIVLLLTTRVLTTYYTQDILVYALVAHPLGRLIVSKNVVFLLEDGQSATPREASTEKDVDEISPKAPFSHYYLVLLCAITLLLVSHTPALWRKKAAGSEIRPRGCVILQ